MHIFFIVEVNEHKRFSFTMYRRGKKKKKITQKTNIVNVTVIAPYFHAKHLRKLVGARSTLPRADTSRTVVDNTTEGTCGHHVSLFFFFFAGPSQLYCFFFQYSLSTAATGKNNETRSGATNNCLAHKTKKKINWGG